LGLLAIVNLTRNLDQVSLGNLGGNPYYWGLVEATLFLKRKLFTSGYLLDLTWVWGHYMGFPDVFLFDFTRGPWGRKPNLFGAHRRGWNSSGDYIAGFFGGGNTKEFNGFTQGLGMGIYKEGILRGPVARKV